MKMGIWSKADRGVLQTWSGQGNKIPSERFLLTKLQAQLLPICPIAWWFTHSYKLLHVYIYVIHKLIICEPLLLLKLRWHCFTLLLVCLVWRKNKTKQTTNPCQFQHFCPYDWQLSSTALLRLLQVGIPSPELIKSVLLLPLIYCHRNQNEHWKTSIFVHFLHK